MSPLSAISKVAFGALSIVGDAGVVPGLGAGATLAEAIKSECEKVSTHKVGRLALSNLCIF